MFNKLKENYIRENCWLEESSSISQDQYYALSESDKAQYHYYAPTERFYKSFIKPTDEDALKLMKAQSAMDISEIKNTLKTIKGVAIFFLVLTIINLIMSVISIVGISSIF